MSSRIVAVAVLFLSLDLCLIVFLISSLVRLMSISLVFTVPAK